MNNPKFKRGDLVRKTKGSQWSGTVVGTYSTALTPEGYAVESSTEKGSVQIYPAAALEKVNIKPASISDWELRRDIERRIATTICEELTLRSPVLAAEAACICRQHGVHHRFDATRCGQDISDSRLNLFTDGKGTVIRMHIG